MNEIKCPNCGEEFSIDENYYNKIVKQIRDKEFAKEVKNIEAKLVSIFLFRLNYSVLRASIGFNSDALYDGNRQISMMSQ